MAGSVVAAILGAALLAAPGSATRSVESRTVGKRRSGDSEICVITANKFTEHYDTLDQLAAGCPWADPGTQVIAFALQDNHLHDFPDHIIVNGKRFNSRGSERMLKDRVGQGDCFSLEAADSNPITRILAAGVNKFSRAALVTCGGVAVAVYSLPEHPVRLGLGSTHLMQTTATTLKGSVAVRVHIGKRVVVIASTHGIEGVRGKDPSKECPSSAAVTPGEKGVAAEHGRVKGFQNALRQISTLRMFGRPSELKGGLVWGGDFNPRTVEPDGERAGCPIWPNSSLPEEKNLERLRRGRDVLGSSPDDLKPVTFKWALQESDLVEADNLVCPTYKKAKQEERKPGQFSCQENGGLAMFYKASHPPSWVDRIFYSTAQAWLRCGEAQRIDHITDHDAVFTTCSVAADR